MELQKALENRRSIRFFTNEIISKKDIIDIIKAGTLAPSSSNRQHWRFVLVNNKDLINKLYTEAGSQKIITRTKQLIVCFYDSRYNNEYHANIQSVSASIQNMLLKAYSLNIGTCWVVGFGDEKALCKLLNTPYYLKPLAIILLGKYKTAPPPPPKRDLNEIFFINKFNIQNERKINNITSKCTLNEIREHQKYVSRSSYIGKNYEIYSQEEISKIISILKDYIDKETIALSLIEYDGTILKQIAEKLEFKELYDCELSKEAIDFMKAKTTRPKYLVYENSIPLKDNSVNLIFMTFSLEKIPIKKELLKESKRILKKNGKLIIFLKNKRSIYGIGNYLLNKVFGVNNIENSYIRSGPFEPLNISKIKKLLKLNNLKVEKQKGLFFVPPEINIFYNKSKNYLKRHGKSLSRLKFLLKPSLKILKSLLIINKIIKSKNFSSSVLIIADQQSL